jgi:hypothetical protein
MEGRIVERIERDQIVGAIAAARESHFREWRPCWITVGEMHAKIGLAFIELAVRQQDERLARRATRPLLAAVAAFQRAGMSRRADAVLRLMDRLQRAYVRHLEGGGA